MDKRIVVFLLRPLSGGLMGCCDPPGPEAVGLGGARAGHRSFTLSPAPAHTTRGGEVLGLPRTHVV